MAHCMVVDGDGNCNGQSNCPCVCGYCNVAARLQLADENKALANENKALVDGNKALHKKVDDLADAFSKYLKQNHPRPGGI